MYSPIGKFAIRRLDGTEYLVPIGGRWSASADLMELNPVSALIWRSLPADLPAIVGEVTSAFRVDKDVATQDTAEFLAELQELGLVEHEL